MIDAQKCVAKVDQGGDARIASHAVAGRLESWPPLLGDIKKLDLRLRSRQREDKMGCSPRFFTLYQAQRFCLRSSWACEPDHDK
jgi:hypothetical protein